MYQKLWICIFLISSFNYSETVLITSFESSIDPISENLNEIRSSKIKRSNNQNQTLFMNSNISYNVPIKYSKYLTNFHTNIPSRIPFDRSSTGRKPSENPKSKQTPYQFNAKFNQQKFAETLNKTESNAYRAFIIKKLQFKEVDQLSNNISNILEKLLINYDKNERPNTEDGKTIVTTNIHVRSMGPMSEQLMEYSLDCYFRQKWHDSRLKYEGPFNSLTLNIHMLQLIWRPDLHGFNQKELIFENFFDITIVNGKGSYVHEITRPNKFLRIYQDGEVYYSMRLTVKARCFMELKNFPMDKQSCPLMFGSYGYQEDELKIVWEHKDPVSLANDLVMSQFDLISYPCRNGTRLFREGRYSMVQVNFNFIRHTGYFLIQIYFPCGLIVVISWVSFWINRENTADRVGLGITSVLTLSTFGLEVSTSGPKVSYPTALNWFMIICFLFANATLIQFSFVHYFTKIGSGELPFYYQKLKTKEKNKEKNKQIKVRKIREKIRNIDEQTKYLKENDLPPDYINRLINSNDLSLLSDELTSYDDSNDNLILNGTSFEDEEEINNNSKLNEKDREIELQMLDIKRILNVVELNKSKFTSHNSSDHHFNELQKTSEKHKLKRRSHSGHSDHQFLASIHCNNLLDDPNHYLVENLENEESTSETADQKMYCPKHNRWFSSTISTTFDEQTENQFSESTLPMHGQFNFNLDINDNLSKMINNSDLNKQWAIDVNRDLDQQIRSNDKIRKKNKIYRDHSLEHQLPFIRWKKVYNQNINPLNAFKLNQLSNTNSQIQPSTAFKRQQFKKSINRYSDKSSSYETDTKPKSFDQSFDQLETNVARKRTVATNLKLDKLDEKKDEFLDDTEADLSRSNRSNEKKAYWFENIKLPKLILQFITCIIASEDYRDHILRDIDEDEHVNSVSKVDTLSKYLFPLSFILVNIIYWLYYYTERSSAFDASWKSESEVFQII